MLTILVLGFLIFKLLEKIGVESGLLRLGHQVDLINQKLFKCSKKSNIVTIMCYMQHITPQHWLCLSCLNEINKILK